MRACGVMSTLSLPGFDAYISRLPVTFSEATCGEDGEGECGRCPSCNPELDSDEEGRDYYADDVDHDRMMDGYDAE